MCVICKTHCNSDKVILYCMWGCYGVVGMYGVVAKWFLTSHPHVIIFQSLLGYQMSLLDFSLILSSKV